MKKTTIFHFATLAFVFSISFISAQNKNVAFDKDNFSKEQRDALKEAVKYIEGGDYLMRFGSGRYRDALNDYEKAQEFNPNNALLNYKIGKCYLQGTNDKLKSIDYFEKAYTLDPNVHSEILYLLGQSHQINSDWNKAEEYYRLFESKLTTLETNITDAEINKRLAECETGKRFTAEPQRVFIDNMGEILNTKYPEYGLILSADESVMMFTAREPGTLGGKKDEFLNQYFEDIYISHFINGQWNKPQNMGPPVNGYGHDATVGLSPNGQKLLIYLDDKGDGNIYECDLKGDAWSEPRKLYKTVNSPYHESSASFSFDGKTLYFVSDRPETGFGEHDIYKSHWNEDKERWGEAENLGATINTKYDEEAVFIHPDGKSLYFSSKGHKGMGGYDIFKSEWDGNKWTKPQNLGHPINSPDDDIFFTLSGSGRHGYYSSAKPDGFGEKDLYKITFLGPEKPVTLNTEDNLLASRTAPVRETVVEPVVEINKSRLTILKGVVKDAETKEPVEGSLELIDNNDGNSVSNFTSNSSTGKYLVSLPSGKNYGLAVKAEGYLFHSENFNIPKEAAYAVVEKNVYLKKIKVGESIILRNIFFDYGKYSLRDESQFELGRVFKIMTDNPSIKVEISGHTDNKGSDTFNQKLSENRAKSVVEFLISNGIDKTRLTYKGYGEEQPISSNDTEEGRQENRRTEFKIVEK